MTGAAALAPRVGSYQTQRVSDDPILFARFLAHGPSVRVRRTSEPGARPVIAVLEVDRRAQSRRGGDEFPPPLMIVEGVSEAEVLDVLRPHALDDRLVAGLMRQKGLR